MDSIDWLGMGHNFSLIILAIRVVSYSSLLMKKTEENDDVKLTQITNPKSELGIFKHKYHVIYKACAASIRVAHDLF